MTNAKSARSHSRMNDTTRPRSSSSARAGSSFLDRFWDVVLGGHFGRSSCVDSDRQLSLHPEVRRALARSISVSTLASCGAEVGRSQATQTRVERRHKDMQEKYLQRTTRPFEAPITSPKEALEEAFLFPYSRASRRLGLFAKNPLRLAIDSYRVPALRLENEGVPAVFLRGLGAVHHDGDRGFQARVRTAERAAQA